MKKGKNAKKKCTTCCRIIRQIKAVLQSPQLNDDTCFQKIEEILAIFEKESLYISFRHDF